MTSLFVPGRANLIGEHLDYNGGAALPFAIQLGTTATISKSDNEALTIVSEGFGRWRQGDIANEEWSRLAQAVSDAFGKPMSASTISLSSTLPIGAGLSSSAAYLGALALALNVEGDLATVSQFLQQCERTAGNEVGLLDYYATLGAREGHALFIDFANMATRDIEVPPSLGFTAIDTGVRRSLVSTPYGLRRDECKKAAELIGTLRSATHHTISMIEDPVIRSRALHVRTEYQRVIDMLIALEHNDDRAVGELVNESHESLSRDFEVSTLKIDEFTQQIRSQRGVHGARLVGGGFGGCVLVVHEPQVTFSVNANSQWKLEVARGAFERIERSRYFSETP
jgi:galactokinase